MAALALEVSTTPAAARLLRFPRDIDMVHAIAHALELTAADLKDGRHERLVNHIVQMVSYFHRTARATGVPHGASTRRQIAKGAGWEDGGGRHKNLVRSQRRWEDIAYDAGLLRIVGAQGGLAWQLMDGWQEHAAPEDSGHPRRHETRRQARQRRVAPWKRRIGNRTRRSFQRGVCRLGTKQLPPPRNSPPTEGRSTEALGIIERLEKAFEQANGAASKGVGELPAALERYEAACARLVAGSGSAGTAARPVERLIDDIEREVTDRAAAGKPRIGALAWWAPRVDGWARGTDRRRRADARLAAQKQAKQKRLDAFMTAYREWTSNSAGANYSQFYRRYWATLSAEGTAGTERASFGGVGHGRTRRMLPSGAASRRAVSRPTAPSAEFLKAYEEWQAAGDGRPFRMP